MLTTVVGNYPRIPSVKDGINLRKAINDEEKGKIDKDRLEEIYQKTIIRTINDQIEAGTDLPPGDHFSVGSSGWAAPLL
jgi:methionine synthase II (cobalamin-independent)